MTEKIKITKGLDIRIAGRPDQSIEHGHQVSQVALLGTDFVGIKPKLLVQVGQTVRLGEPLLVDKRDPQVKYVSPGSGQVVAINRGRRRKLQSIVVELRDSDDSESTFDREGLDDPPAVRDLLLRSGLWTGLRTRPFDRVADSTSVPRAIFVTAVDTRPLCADPRVVIARRSSDFKNGLAALRRLGDWPVYLCTGPNWPYSTTDDEGIRHVEFSGPHPSGLPGTHIHYLDPAGADRTVWHIGYQDVMTIGHLFRTGRLTTERIVSIGGPLAVRPRLLRTRMGANVTDLMRGELKKNSGYRVISGSVLDGSAAAGTLGFIGRYHNQISIVSDVAQRRLLGWLSLRPRLFNAPHPQVNVGQRKLHAYTTAANGRCAAMMPVEAFERVMPLNILPSPLLRAMLVKDTDAAQSLGCLELAEEDLALTSFVCPAKQNYAATLRLNLDQIEREG